MRNIFKMAFHFNPMRWTFSLSLAALVFGLAACNSSSPTGSESPDSTGSSPAASSQAASGSKVTLNGAGASLPNPLYQKWFAEYNKQNPNIQISYQSVGSGAGINQFLEQTVDFGATDSPLKDEERAKFPAERGKAIQIPTTAGVIVFAYNLEGVDGLKLPRTVYCGIVDGSIKKWNDPKIAAANTGAKLPDQDITFVHRSDGSGTTSIFTKHIEKACPNWKAGSGKSVEWPTGVGAKGNEGVSAQISQSVGTIGYTELSYAREVKLKMAAIENKAGEIIEPTPEAAAKALAGITLKEDMSASVPDPEAKGAYPIFGLTYLLLYENYPDQAKADALKGLVKWALKDGGKYADELGYLPIPTEVADKVVATLDTIKVASK